MTYGLVMPDVAPRGERGHPSPVPWNQRGNPAPADTGSPMRTFIQCLQIFSGVLGIGMVAWAFWYFSPRRH